MKQLQSVLGIISLICATSVSAQSSYEASPLKTQTINEVGITLSSYKYSEPNLTTFTGQPTSVTMQATNVGIEYLGTYAFQNNWFVLGEFDYNNGPVKYTGTGTQSGIPQYYYNLKAAVGYDFVVNNVVVSPYIGLGYRFLSQQWGSTTTSTGNIGYDRQSTYNYIPIGVINRLAINEKSQLVSTLEYDYLISGNQYSGLSSVNGTSGGNTLSGVPNVNNSQNSGYGLNLTVMYKEEKWGVGPYLKYWNIKQSNTVSGTYTVNGSLYRGSVYEPANNTLEYGVKAIYRF
jgi:hypothetical protein